jgi:hypothetical protein
MHYPTTAVDEDERSTPPSLGDEDTDCRDPISCVRSIIIGLRVRLIRACHRPPQIPDFELYFPRLEHMA